MTKTELAHQTRVYRACRELAVTLAALPPASSPAKVVEAFAANTDQRRVRADAFLLMDTEPSRFEHYQAWHPVLRSCRNHPTHGRELFALFH